MPTERNQESAMNDVDGSDGGFALGFRLLAIALVIGLLALSVQGLFASPVRAPAAQPVAAATTTQTATVAGGYFSAQFRLNPERRPPASVMH
jgi:hypothetical protein